MQRGKADRARVDSLKAEKEAEPAAAEGADGQAADEAAAAAAEFTGTDEESAAAVKIQAMQRGKADRARVDALKAESAEAVDGAAADAAAAAAAEFTGTDDENAAATKLQAMQRGKVARAEVAAKKAAPAADPADGCRARIFHVNDVYVLDNLPALKTCVAQESEVEQCKFTPA
jgi:hypothetical protein